MPPTTPAIMPAKSGALEARATPRHRGRATRKTTIDAGISAAALRNNLFMETIVLNNKTPEEDQDDPLKGVNQALGGGL
jgi:hypothetical protein